ncbi:FUSC family protein [Rhodopila sp.]|uniref:FUSC family protein n=1 Tax=Rhodopila sp. TaxID=2480087 RepID=UPI003D15175C
MPTVHSAPDLHRLPIIVNRRGISLAEGVRAGLSVAVMSAAAEYLQFPPLLEAALAALLTCLCDPGGPIRRRVPVLLSFIVIAVAVNAGLGLLLGRSPPAAVVIGVFGLFCASFARIYGPVPQQLGTLLSVVQILALDHAIPDLKHAAMRSAAFIGGGLWATLLTMVIWRIYPYLPARRAVAEAYHRLSDLISDLHALVQTPAVTDAAWEAHARIHRRAVREAIEAARIIVLDTLRGRGGVSNRAAQSLIRLETADQIFGALIAFSDLLEHGTGKQRAGVAPILRRTRPLLLILGRAILTDDPDVHRRIDRSIDAIVAAAAKLPPDAPLRAVVGQITERLRIAHTLAVPANFNPGVDAAGRPIPLWQRITHPVRDNLSWQSPALRHALRCAVTAAIPLAITMIWFMPYDHWMTITVVVTMQPYFSLTYTRAIERVGGTVAGGLVAAVVGLVCTTPLSIAAAMLPLAVAAQAIRAVSYGLYMMVLTPLVVLLVETGAPGANEWRIAFARVALTTIGGIIAVAANFLLWPHREPALVAAEVRRAIAAHGVYAEAAFAVLLQQPLADRSASRRAAGIASNTLEALITRALLQPGRGKPDRLEAAMVIDAALRRCAGRLTALQLDPALADQSAQALRAWRDWIIDALRGLASGQHALKPRPTGLEADTLQRIARQIELIAGAMERLED